MADERPFGWRPFTDDRRAQLRASGWSDEQIAEIEKDNAYQPVAHAIASTEIAVAVFRVCARRFGPEFVHEVRSELEQRAAVLSASEESDDQVEGAIVRDLMGEFDWDKLVTDASG